MAADSQNFERITTTPPGLRLGSIELIDDGMARNFVIEIGNSRFHGFIVRRALDVFGYVDLCPHRNVPLARKLDDYLTPDGSLISCSWHGALFNIDDGVCVGGPCAGSQLQLWPVEVVDGNLVTA